MSNEICPDCGVILPKSTGAQHPYIGSSTSCWTLYTWLLGGDPPIAESPRKFLLNDAYCVQHHGLPEKAAAVQSVAIHLVTLYAVLKQGHTDTYWLRNRMLRGNRHNRFTWLTPPENNKAWTIQQIVQGDSPEDRATLLLTYINSVADSWLALHEAKVIEWYEKFVLAERLD